MKIRSTFWRWGVRSAALACWLWAVQSPTAAAEAQPAPEAPWWGAAVESALSQAATNRDEILRTLREAPSAQRTGVEFLVTNMPVADLRTLPASLLLTNLQLAYRARDEMPWGKAIPAELFLNDVLPYALLNEVRDDWRGKLYDLCAPLVKDCREPGEAAHRLNQKLFPLVKVKYSTARKKPHQSPLETMETGIASCTGLSILWADACRAVGIPARVVGTPMWVNGSGNHTWVEVWDKGWHFGGAAEPDPQGLDRGWFVGNASQAVKDNPRNAIYASSYQVTALAFPLPWAGRSARVSAVNVTDRYASKATPAAPSSVRLLVRVLDHPAGKRAAAQVTVTDPRDAAFRATGTSRVETNDMNDVLTFPLAANHRYRLVVEQGDVRWERDYTTETNAEETVFFCLRPNPALRSAATTYERPKIARELSLDQANELRREMGAFFAASEEKRTNWSFPAPLEQLLAENEPAVRKVAWQAYAAAPLHAELERDFKTNQVRFEKHLSPYTVKTVGQRPAAGWALFIAMHGGGNAPKQVNDSQWRVMHRYYRDHPELGGYVYVALRAPNDTWNGFYDDYVYPLVANLLRQFLLFGDVDPNKVFAMGYSHGGYGAFAIGPKMPDRFAAVHASAAAPTDGETTPRGLRSTVFGFMVGEKDTMYGRLERCVKFDQAIEQLRGSRSDIYPVSFQLIAGNGHTGLPDRDKIVDLYPHTRNPVPREITWLMTDKVIRHLFWIEAGQPAKQREIDALCQDNRITVSTTNTPAAAVWLDRRLVDFDRPITLVVNGRTQVCDARPSLRALGQSLLERGDPELAFTARIELPLATAE